MNSLPNVLKLLNTNFSLKENSYFMQVILAINFILFLRAQQLFLFSKILSILGVSMSGCATLISMLKSTMTQRMIKRCGESIKKKWIKPKTYCK